MLNAFLLTNISGSKYPLVCSLSANIHGLVVLFSLSEIDKTSSTSVFFSPRSSQAKTELENMSEKAEHDSRDSINISENQIPVLDFENLSVEAHRTMAFFMHNHSGIPCTFALAPEKYCPAIDLLNPQSLLAQTKPEKTLETQKINQNTLLSALGFTVHNSRNRSQTIDSDLKRVKTSDSSLSKPQSNQKARSGVLQKESSLRRLRGLTLDSQQSENREKSKQSTRARTGFSFFLFFFFFLYCRSNFFRGART